MSKRNFHDIINPFLDVVINLLSIYFTLKLLYTFFLKMMVSTKCCLPTQHFQHATSQNYLRIHFSLSMCLMISRYLLSGIKVRNTKTDFNIGYTWLQIGWSTTLRIVSGSISVFLFNSF